MDQNKINIRSLTLEEIIDFLAKRGEKPFRAKQIWQWIWQRGVTDFNEMSNLSKNTRELLENHLKYKHLTIQRK